ncbi:response regulator transcription factor [Flavisolibacter tropicus]|uniref:LuxR family transcriptional regulator n=1 Tax=Flavisolibacter tropicus TaxID=1492898 RepID=A0A172TSM7_9BACT|nr:DNA-binding response regulator [Flavisolibacter tropicus]ANE50085.1 LuxR family transcriptional regulator [Flavisolibacter tropicus]
MTLRILIVEDEIIIARFIEQQLKTNFSCTTQIALSAKEAQVAMENFQPHLLLCDIHLEEELTGITLVTELRQQYYFEVIYITSYQSRPIIEKASATNPANYLIKPIDEAQLYAGIQLVLPKIQNQPQSGKKPEAPDALLNETELRILQLIREQKTTKEIAADLHLSPYTIKNHRHKICRKLELKDENNALLRWALENNYPAGN